MIYKNNGRFICIWIEIKTNWSVKLTSLCNFCMTSMILILNACEGGMKFKMWINCTCACSVQFNQHWCQRLTAEQYIPKPILIDIKVKKCSAVGRYNWVEIRFVSSFTNVTCIVCDVFKFGMQFPNIDASQKVLCLYFDRVPE